MTAGDQQSKEGQQPEYKRRPAPKNAREAAAQILEVLDELDLDVGEAQEAGDIKDQTSPLCGATAPSERVRALLADAMCLAEGIASGVITVGQPRLAFNLIEVVSELDKCGQDSLVLRVYPVIRHLSHGIAAEGCSLSRNRNRSDDTLIS